MAAQEFVFYTMYGFELKTLNLMIEKKKVSNLVLHWDYIFILYNAQCCFHKSGNTGAQESMPCVSGSGLLKKKGFKGSFAEVGPSAKVWF